MQQGLLGKNLNVGFQNALCETNNYKAHIHKDLLNQT